MARPSPEGLASIEKALGEAVKASLGVAAPLRGGFIADYLLACLDGRVPQIVPLPQQHKPSLAAELPSLASELSMALNAGVAVDVESPLRHVAAYLLRGKIDGTTLAQPVIPAGKQSPIEIVTGKRETTATPEATPAMRSVEGTAALPAVGLEPVSSVAELQSVPQPTMLPSDKLWKCSCSTVKIVLSGEPLWDCDCHCTCCLPVAQYLDAKGRNAGVVGTSAICASGMGVAKSFFLLDKVSIVNGRQYLKSLKRSATGTNVRVYAACCNTLCVTDGGDSIDPPYRSFSRTCISCADGSPYAPAGVPATGGADNPNFEEVSDPKFAGYPAQIETQVEEFSQWENERRDAVAGQFGPSGEDPKLFYAKASQTKEVAMGVVGLEDALRDFVADAKAKALAEEAARIAAEKEAQRLAAEEAALIKASKEAALMASHSIQTKSLDVADELDVDNIVSNLAKQMVVDASETAVELNPDL